MKATEFCYWLQGYFELADTDAPRMGPRQMKIIKAHLDLVHQVEPEHDCLFVSWLAMLTENSEDGLSTRDIAKIRRHLVFQFKHVIDPAYGGDQSALQAVHDGHHIGPPTGYAGGPVYRC